MPYFVATQRRPALFLQKQRSGLRGGNRREGEGCKINEKKRKEKETERERENTPAAA